jgi:hypothetical protein
MSLARSLAAEVRLERIRDRADMSETGVTETGMSRQGVVATTAMVGGAAQRDVAVATGTRDEGDSALLLYNRRLSNLERNSLSRLEQEMST